MNNSPIYVRRRVLVAVWGSVILAQICWIVPMLYTALDARLGL